MEIARKRKWIEFDGSIQQQHQHQLTCVDTDEEDDHCELLLKEESKQKIYIQMQSCITFMCFRWFIADISSNLLEEANDMMNSMPNILQNTQGYATALLKSKLFFLGGEIWDKLNPKHNMLSIENVRKTVFAFDVVTQTWDDPSEYPNLLSPRLLGRAQAVDDKIFVFGSYNNGLLLKHEQHYAEYLDLSSSKEKRMWRYISDTPRQLYEKPYIQSIAVCNSNSNKAKSSVGGEKHHFLFWVFPYGCLFILDYHSLKWQTVEQIFGYLPKEPCTTKELRFELPQEETVYQIFEYPPYTTKDNFQCLPQARCTTKELSLDLAQQIAEPNFECEPYTIEEFHPNLAPCWSNTVVFQDDALFWHFGSRIYAYDFTSSNPGEVLDLCNFNYTLFLEYAKDNFSADYFPATFLVSQGKGKLCLIWEGYVDEPIRFYCLNFQVQRKNDGTLVVRPGSLSNFNSHPDFQEVMNLYLV